MKVQMPLYQGGGLTARRNAAGHAVEAAQSTIQRTRLEVRQKLLEARSQVMSLLSTLQIQGRQEALSARTRELYQQQYLDLGSRPLLDVLNAEQEVYRAFHPATDPWPAASAAAQPPLQHRAAAPCSILITAPSRPWRSSHERA